MLTSKTHFGKLSLDIGDENINLAQYPTVINTTPGSCTELTIGDLHGNALKLLYILVREGVINISKKNYERFAEIYQTPADELDDFDISDLKSILSKITINHTKLVRLLGDDTADRGNNDYITLCLLCALQKKKLPIEILFSNHAGLFHRVFDLFQYYKNMHNDNIDEENLLAIIIKITQGFRPEPESLISLGLLFDLVSLKKMERMVWKYYKPNVKLISYTILDDKHINLYMHAPNGFETIAALAKHYQVNFDPSTPYTLTQTIDAINERFNINLCNGQFVRDYLIEENADIGYDNTLAGKLYSPLTAPHYRLVWNRIHSTATGYGLTFPELNYHITIIHGHTGHGVEESIPGWHKHPQISLCSLDTELGKDPLLDAQPQPGYCTLQTKNYASSFQSYKRTLPQEKDFNPEYLPRNLFELLDKQVKKSQKLDAEFNYLNEQVKAALASSEQLISDHASPKGKRKADNVTELPSYDEKRGNFSL